MYKNNYKKSLLAMAVGTAMFAGSATGADFYLGEDEDVLVQINSQLSFGATWRMAERDPRYVSNTNGGLGLSSTTDDGNLNFDKGDMVSSIVKGLHDISISKDNYGAFFRVKYWYDDELSNGERQHGNSANGYMPGEPLSDDGFEDNAKFSGFTLLDAYVYGNFDLGDVPLDVRLGRQVISWGESTFIQGGLNSSNPFDVNALRRPGAELKEGILPVGMLYASAGLTDNITLEAFYQYEWGMTQVEGCGTFFSTNDFAGTGCDWVTVGPGDKASLDLGYAAKREADIQPDDGGQYGVALRIFSPELNDTEFGLYYMNIHSRVPMVNAIRGDWTSINPALPPLLPHSAAVSLDAAYPTLAAGYAAGVLTPEQIGQFGVASVLQATGTDRAFIDAMNPGYLIEFPEDLQYFGASFATNVAGFALSGEISYKPDTPIQLNGNHVLAAALGEAPIPFTAELVAGGSGQMARGWDAFDVTQMQVTALQFYERVLGASRVTVIAEAGVVLTDGIEAAGEEQGMYYGRNPVFGLNIPSLGNYLEGLGMPAPVAAGTAAAINTGTGDEGFVTDTAWGYRVRAEFDYPNAIGGISLKPTLSWSHDVSGYSPEPGQQFHEGKTSLGLSVAASYQQKYSMTLGYTAFDGGDYNVSTDKDFLAVSFGVSY